MATLTKTVTYEEWLEMPEVPRTASRLSHGQPRPKLLPEGVVEVALVWPD
ncbi:MAG TPA: hypothetical protein VL285_03500 [Bryobacteraceae bacterium]|nr:hypothetical protein [Bryobacteraceae bacterium]